MPRGGFEPAPFHLIWSISTTQVTEVKRIRVLGRLTRQCLNALIHRPFNSLFKPFFFSSWVTFPYRVRQIYFTYIFIYVCAKYIIQYSIQPVNSIEWVGKMCKKKKLFTHHSNPTLKQKRKNMKKKIGGGGGLKKLLGNPLCEQPWIRG